MKLVLSPRPCTKVIFWNFYLHFGLTKFPLDLPSYQLYKLYCNSLFRHGKNSHSSLPLFTSPNVMRNHFYKPWVPSDGEPVKDGCSTNFDPFDPIIICNDKHNTRLNLTFFFFRHDCLDGFHNISTGQRREW